jgi:uncharacterized tellurite resistance protein B-like protein
LFQSGANPKQLSSGSIFNSLFVLTRRLGVRTNINRAVASAHCPGCGAAESDVESHACEYCEAVLNTGEHDWVLANVHSMNSPGARAWLKRLKRGSKSVEAEIGPSISNVMAWMIKTMMADGELHEGEMKVAIDLATKVGMPMSEVEGTIEAALKNHLHAPEPANSKQARAWLNVMADVALADGEVRPEEQRALNSLGKRADLTPHDVRHLINKRRSRIYRQTRERQKTERRRSSSDSK